MSYSLIKFTIKIFIGTIRDYKLPSLPCKVTPSDSKELKKQEEELLGKRLHVSHGVHPNFVYEEEGYVFRLCFEC